MLKKILKVGLGAIILTLSPFIIVLIVGLLFILFHMTGGASFIEGYELFVQLIEGAKPYFPILTFVPMVFIGIPMALTFVKKRKAKQAVDEE